MLGTLQVQLCKDGSESAVPDLRLRASLIGKSDTRALMTSEAGGHSTLTGGRRRRGG